MNLVTGATGILGSHVALALLLDAQEVVATRRQGSDMSKVKELFGYYTKDHQNLFDRIKWIEIDLLDVLALEEAVEGISTVYHCAGMVSFYAADRERLFRFNESVTAGIVNVCLQKNLVLCHVSSIGTINNSDRQVLDEDVFWKKSGKESNYAVSKYNAERQVWRGIEEGLRGVIVNPGVIISPVFWDQSSGRIFRRCAKGSFFYTGGSSAYIGAMDAAKAMVALVKGAHFSGRYILAEDNYSFKSILSRIQSNFGKPGPKYRIPKKLLGFLTVLNGFLAFLLRKRPVLTKSLVNSACNRQLYSNSKIKSTLALEFEPIPELLDRICAYYQTVSEKPKPSI